MLASRSLQRDGLRVQKQEELTGLRNSYLVHPLPPFRARVRVPHLNVLVLLRLKHLPGLGLLGLDLPLDVAGRFAARGRRGEASDLREGGRARRAEEREGRAGGRRRRRRGERCCKERPRKGRHDPRNRSGKSSRRRGGRIRQGGRVQGRKKGSQLKLRPKNTIDCDRHNSD